MSHKYRVTKARFEGGILYEPGKREIIIRDKPFPKDTAGVELLSEAAAKKGLTRQQAADAKKKSQVKEGEDALKSAGGLSIKAENTKGGSVETLT